VASTTAKKIVGSIVELDVARVKEQVLLGTVGMVEGPWFFGYSLHLKRHCRKDGELVIVC
jgi:hypothetical protein